VPVARSWNMICDAPDCLSKRVSGDPVNVAMPKVTP
jgi:hypothetical protein